MHSKAQDPFSKTSNPVETFPTYTGNNLGLTYTANQSSFRIWAPTATKAQLKLW
jgi:hypothetical protein